MTTKPRLNKYGTNLDAVAASTYPGHADTDIVTEYCWKCGGRGRLPGYEYSDGARCWGCMGTGGAHQVSVGDARRAARKRATDQDRNASKRAAAASEYIARRQAVLDAWKTANQDLAATLAAVDIYGSEAPLLRTLAAVIQSGGYLDESDTEAARRLVAEREARAAAAPLAEGRSVIRGRVRSLKWVENPFGFGASTLKMTVELPGGQRVFGTSPACHAAGVGDHVEFTATVTRAEPDHTFGFFKRPSKARVLTDDA